MRVSQTSWIVSRMLEYPRGGFFYSTDMACMMEGLAEELAGGHKDEVLIVSGRNGDDEMFKEFPNVRAADGLKGPNSIDPETKMVLIIDVSPTAISNDLTVTLQEFLIPVWVFCNHTRTLTASVTRRLGDKLWPKGTYTPYICEKAGVSEVVTYNQPESEKFVAFMSAARQIMDKRKAKKTVQELAFLPHLAFAEIAMEGDQDMTPTLTAKKVSDIKDEQVNDLASAMFRTGKLSHLDMLSVPDCVYSCGEALKREVANAKANRERFVVALRNDQYKKYTARLLEEGTPVKTFTEVIKNWGAYDTIFLPMGVDWTYTAGSNLIRMMMTPGSHKTVTFVPESDDVHEFCHNKPTVNTMGVESAVTGLVAELNRRWRRDNPVDAS
ncbi:hypothetical protein [Tiger frog virus]|uniref:Surface protein n=1 Tax=Rana tigrina ranavirus TaxID=160691 RepID=A0A6M8PJH6_RTRV|nr:hypothetical protein [Tiger frog virus]